MKLNSKIVRFYSGIFLLISTLYSCVKNRDFKSQETNCSNTLKANASYADVKDLYVDKTIQIQEDLIIEGYVISSDEAGNFFSELYFQDKSNNPTEGFQIEVDARETHLIYPIGRKIILNLKGLYLGKSKGVYKVGGVFASFGNQSVGRLPASVLEQHISISCGEVVNVIPKVITLNDSLNNYINTLVSINKIEFIGDDLGLSFAITREETLRTLTNCDDQKIGLLNSGFSDFQNSILPFKKGSVTAVLTKENDDFFLRIRSLNDIYFIEDRCEDLVDEFTSREVFISEIADPDNNSKARFVELFNSGANTISLKNWNLSRYTNANTETSSSINLSENDLEPGATLVIASNGGEFENTYGFSADIIGGTGSAADSNGDDTIVLIDPFGEIIDIFGVVGEDGSSTNHEFEDGKAVRKSNIVQANPVFNFNEWIIYNDTGDSGTINQPQNAPQDFNPGQN